MARVTALTSTAANVQYVTTIMSSKTPSISIVQNPLSVTTIESMRANGINWIRPTTYIRVRTDENIPKFYDIPIQQQRNVETGPEISEYFYTGAISVLKGGNEVERLTVLFADSDLGIGSVTDLPASIFNESTLTTNMSTLSAILGVPINNIQLIYYIQG